MRAGGLATVGYRRGRARIDMIADCSEVRIVPRWACIGLCSKGSPRGGRNNRKPFQEGEQRVGRQVAAGRFVDDVYTRSGQQRVEFAYADGDSTRRAGCRAHRPIRNIRFLHLCIGGWEEAARAVGLFRHPVANALTSQAIHWRSTATSEQS
jgi:hypothetical protein